MQKNFEITLDTIKTTRNQLLNVNTNDLNSLSFNITIQEKGKTLDLTGLTVRIAIVKPDKTTVLQNCTIEDAKEGLCKVVLTTQSYIVHGLHVAELMLFKGTESVAVTDRFSYNAVRGILDNQTIQSTNDWQAINQAIADAEGILIDLRENGTGVDAQARADLVEASTKLNTSTSTKRPLVVFISDDGKIGDYNIVAPAFDAKGVPCNFAIITKEVGKSGFLTSSQIQDLYNRGHGMLSHTHSHEDMATLTETALDADFNASSQKMNELLGKNWGGLVYPYGSSNETVVKVARKYFNYAFATVAEGYLLNDDYLDQYVIPRDVVVYSMGANPRTLDNIKPLIDRCKNEKKLLVYCIHAAEFEGGYSANLDLLNIVIDYIKQSGIDIVTHDVAMKEKGNVLDIGTFKTNYVKISKSGAIYSNNLDKTLKLGNSFNSEATVAATTPLSSFEQGKITRNIIYSDSATGFPKTNGGALFTYYNLFGSDMNFQIYYPQNSTSFYRRDWNRWSNVWNPWNEFRPYSSDIYDKVVRTNTTPLTEFPVGITHTKIGSGEVTGFPEGVPGLLITYYNWENTDMNFQMFYPQNSSRVYRRNWNRWSSVWYDWSGMLVGSNTKNISVEGFTLNAGAQHYVDVTVSGAVSGDRIIATPRSVIPQGVIVDTMVPSGGKVRIRFYNATTATQTINTTVFDVTVIK
ncbi:MAG: BppU family phage baseplate upper protein [Bacillota bacterium]